MKKIALLFVLVSGFLFSQNKTEAEKKVEEGVQFHDQGKYTDAIAKYDEALQLDHLNLYALAEKAMTLESIKEYDKAIDICKQILQLYPNENNKTVYIVYGNSLDHLGKPEESVKIYDEGIKKYPDYYQLYFNKGITYAGAKQYDKASTFVQMASKLNPNHAGSFNALGVLANENRVASILASSRYLVIDNKSARAKLNLESILNLMKKGVSEKDDNSIHLTLDESILKGVEKNKKTENNFSTADMALSMAAALDYDKKNKDKTDLQKFTEKFTTMVQVMNETKKNQTGYYWEFLAPYFIEMNNKKLVDAFSNLIFLASGNSEAKSYLEKNPEKIKDFTDWNSQYSWKK